MHPPKPISLFSDENYLNEPQDTEFIRTIINLIKELMKSQKDTNRLNGDTINA